MAEKCVFFLNEQWVLQGVQRVHYWLEHSTFPLNEEMILQGVIV
jgi:hypothetical protein